MTTASTADIEKRLAKLEKQVIQLLSMIKAVNNENVRLRRAIHRANDSITNVERIARTSNK